jgi:hypothetical protein
MGLQTSDGDGHGSKGNEDQLFAVQQVLATE